MNWSTIEAHARRFFDSLEAYQASMSEHWKQHANRRSIIILIALGALALYVYLALIRPPETFPIGELIEVPSGIPVSVLAETLEAQGVIQSSLTFKALVFILGSERSVRAGDYLFKEPQDVIRIARAMSIGAYGLEPQRIRIPEGATVERMARIYDARLQRFDKDNFIAQAKPLEGYLFPDTYFFLPNANEATVIQTMKQNFDTQIATIQPQIDAYGKPLNEIVTMASIIELEAHNSEDRRTISSVLWNRMQKGMALQVDVTFLYTIGKGTFQLTKADLASDSPYNTYVHKGLPPTPIGSPSLDAILAAVNPAKTDYLFFMADLNGVTHFCRTHACHEANKRRYY